MGHEITESDRMFSVREAPWHIVETRDRVSVPGEYPGRELGMKLAGHDFEVEERPVLVSHGEIPSWASGATGVLAPGWKALVRADNGHVLHIARDTYRVVQASELWDLQEQIQQIEPDKIRWETAGTLRGGAVLWVLARLDEPDFVPGDDSPTYPYVLTSTTHDGTGALKAQLTSIRVVCWNTFQAAQRGGGNSFTFRHTRNIGERLSEARAALRGLRAQHHEYMELCRELAEINVGDHQVEAFLGRFIPQPPDYLISERVQQNVDIARQTIRYTLDASPTIPEAHRRTAYGLFCAGIEYLDHQRRYRSGDTLFGRTLLRQERLKDNLVRLVHSVAR
jgi:phage/plasmid-like protein (TIGR03299 family)